MKEGRRRKSRTDALTESFGSETGEESASQESFFWMVPPVNASSCSDASFTFSETCCEPFVPEMEGPSSEPKKGPAPVVLNSSSDQGHQLAEKTDQDRKGGAQSDSQGQHSAAMQEVDREEAAHEEDADLDSEEGVAPLGKPKKLSTRDSVLIRSLTREGWEAIAQQPFASRKFYGKQLESWSPVNVGQLLGFASQKGGRPQVPNQDEYAVMHEAGYQIYLVVDGHGDEGESAAKFVRRWLTDAFLSLVRRRNGRVLAAGELSGVFARLHEAVEREQVRGARAQCSDMHNSGCTAAVAVVTPTRSLRGAWLGDCECVAGRRSRPGAETEPEQPGSLTPPHVTPSPPRLTRAIGHLSLPLLLHEADEFVEADIDLAHIDFIVVGSGGLWRGLSKTRAVAEVCEAGPYFVQHTCSRLASLSQEAQMLAADAQLRGPAEVEDATAIIVWLGTVPDD